MSLVKLGKLCLLAREEVVSDSLHIDWLGLPGHWNVLLCRISQGKGMLGLIRVDLRSRRMSSRGFFPIRVS